MKKVFLLLAVALLLGCVQPGTEEVKDVLELKEGFKYAYSMTAKYSEIDTFDIYVTNESDDYWKGVITVTGEDNGNKKAVMVGFKVGKRNNAVAFSKMLRPDQALDESLIYNIMPTESDQLSGPYEYFLAPFTLAALSSILGVDIEALFEEGELEVPAMGATLTAESTKSSGFEAYRISAEGMPKPFTVATVAPYLIISIDMDSSISLDLESVEKADFDPDAWTDVEIVTAP